MQNLIERIKTKKEKVVLIIVVAIFVMISAVAYWDLKVNNILNTSNNQVGTNSNKPPNEAISACANKNVGDTCEFNDKKQITQGTCDNKPGLLACSPNNKEQPTINPIINISITPTKKINSLSNASFSLISEIGTDGSTLPVEYTCDGKGASPAFSWSGMPTNTKELMLMMTTVPVDGNTKWSWILSNIPISVANIAKNNTNIGTVLIPYKTPCSQGPGSHTYTFTLYALSTSPTIANSTQLSGADITKAISSITLSSATINFNYTRIK